MKAVAQSYTGLTRRAALQCAAALGLLLFVAGCRRASVAYDPAANAPDETGTVVSAARTPVVRQPPRSTPQAGRAPDIVGGDASWGPVHGKPSSVEVGLASWYGPPYHHHQAADGSIFDQNALTAAHRTLPLGTLVRVTNLATGDSVVAKITDRGPFIPGRTLDLSLAAAKAIGIYQAGVAKVRVEAFTDPAADPVGRWCVQVGTFIDPADAVQLKNDLSNRYGKVAKVIEFAGPTGYWVRINPEAPAEEATAEKIAASIHLPDAEPYVVRLN
jgi:rare lipoprotein A